MTKDSGETRGETRVTTCVEDLNEILARVGILFALIFLGLVVWVGVTVFFLGLSIVFTLSVCWVLDCNSNLDWCVYFVFGIEVFVALCYALAATVDFLIARTLRTTNRKTRVLDRKSRTEEL